MDFFSEWLEQHRGKIIGGILGLVAGIIIITLGFFKALFIVLCSIGGFYIGNIIDNNISIRDIIDKILPPGSR